LKSPALRGYPFLLFLNTIYGNYKEKARPEKAKGKQALGGPTRKKKTLGGRAMDPPIQPLKKKNILLRLEGAGTD